MVCSARTPATATANYSTAASPSKRQLHAQNCGVLLFHEYNSTCGACVWHSNQNAENQPTFKFQIAGTFELILSNSLFPLRNAIKRLQSLIHGVEVRARLWTRVRVAALYHLPPTPLAPDAVISQCEGLIVPSSRVGHERNKHDLFARDLIDVCRSAVVEILGHTHDLCEQRVVAKVCVRESE